MVYHRSVSLFGEPKRCAELLNGATWDHRESDLFLSQQPVPPFLHICGDDRVAFERRAVAALRSLVDGWLAAGRDWEKWQSANIPACNAVNSMLSRWHFTLAADTGGKRYGPLGPRLQPVKSLETPDQLLQAFAAWHFLALLLHQDGQRVGQCARCGQYFYSALRRGNKLYCSRACNRTAGAMRAVRAQREAERKRKLNTVRKALARLPAQRRAEWKRFVIEDARRRGVRLTPNFLTLAVNRGHLTAPRT